MFHAVENMGGRDEILSRVQRDEKARALMVGIACLPIADYRHAIKFGKLCHLARLPPKGCKEVDLNNFREASRP